ncbi:MAG TPA: M28 family peptidase [Bacteroidia bacterium]|nr:M28 family peptidase [Bacteroidia bacterium]HRH09343.1 M28 family peptidase [Bacteroidia bacterium]
MKIKVLYIVGSIGLLYACSNPAPEVQNTLPDTPVQEVQKVKAPDFNSDSAFGFLKKQVDFGPRVPGTKAHANCAEFFQRKLKSYQLEVVLQEAPVSTFDGNKFTLKNVIGAYRPQLKNRILLTAHWDSRPFADEDVKNIGKPIDGANDGASGAAVLLEIARQLSIHQPSIGVDFLLNDLEDYGEPDGGMMLQRKTDTWCLGTQYWAKNKSSDYQPKFGILLDMVGGKNPTFPKEGTSLAYAPEIVEKVWMVAANLGYSKYFVSDQTGQTTDDHLYINSLANIPCIDIVHMNPATGTYPEFHHTHSDNLNGIDKNTLKIVGQTVLQVLYEEQ